VDAGALWTVRSSEPFAPLDGQVALEGKGGPELGYRFVRFGEQGMKPDRVALEVARKVTRTRITFITFCPTQPAEPVKSASVRTSTRTRTRCGACPSLSMDEKGASGNAQENLRSARAQRGSSRWPATLTLMTVAYRFSHSGFADEMSAGMPFFGKPYPRQRTSILRRESFGT
jgi:hypothetical protein